MYVETFGRELESNNKCPYLDAWSWYVQLYIRDADSWGCTKEACCRSSNGWSLKPYILPQSLSLHATLPGDLERHFRSRLNTEGNVAHWGLHWKRRGLDGCRNSCPVGRLLENTCPSCIWTAKVPKIMDPILPIGSTCRLIPYPFFGCLILGLGS